MVTTPTRIILSMKAVSGFVSAGISRRSTLTIPCRASNTLRRWCGRFSQDRHSIRRSSESFPKVLNPATNECTHAEGF